MICPECNGRGEAVYYVETDRDGNSVTVEQRKGICRTCNGSGEKAQTNADRMVAMLQAMDACGLLDWWQKIFEDGVPGEDYFKWWLQQPAEE